MKLYSYFRSSAAYRVRIALNLKGIEYQMLPVSLLKNEQFADDFRRLNPQSLVPTLVDGGSVLTQSLAICEYLDEVQPEPPLLPRAAAERARVRAIALAIACEIHPLNNLRVLRHLKKTLGQDDAQRDAWYRHWIAEGLTPLEAMLAASPQTGSFCHGDTPGLADACLVPQAAHLRALSEPAGVRPCAAGESAGRSLSDFTGRNCQRRAGQISTSPDSAMRQPVMRHGPGLRPFGGGSCSSVYTATCTRPSLSTTCRCCTAMPSTSAVSRKAVEYGRYSGW